MQPWRQRSSRSGRVAAGGGGPAEPAAATRRESKVTLTVDRDALEAEISATAAQVTRPRAVEGGPGRTRADQGGPGRTRATRRARFLCRAAPPCYATPPWPLVALRLIGHAAHPWPATPPCHPPPTHHPHQATESGRGYSYEQAPRKWGQWLQSHAEWSAASAGGDAAAGKVAAGKVAGKVAGKAAGKVAGKAGDGTQKRTAAKPKCGAAAAKPRLTPPERSSSRVTASAAETTAAAKAAATAAAAAVARKPARQQACRVTPRLAGKLADSPSGKLEFSSKKRRRA